ncbi:MAG TPA: hypothetical protein GXX40_02110 [Firmicutes bacterium]|nr:hypothetical protein [Bacillota bacterium]
MDFWVAEEVFEIAPSYCVGVVVARGIDNSGKDDRVEELLRANVAARRAKLPGTPALVKKLPQIACWRAAFERAAINPNRFPPSIEALCLRLAKGGELPRINKLVDLCNALSIKYMLPMGAHDLGCFHGDISVRLSSEGEPFTPIMSQERETVPAGEVVYADGCEVRTRRWIWRQGERGKVTERTTEVFCPIDGFTDINRKEVLAAREELAALITRFFGTQARVYWVNRENPRTAL